MVLTEHLSNPPYPFRRLCDQDVRDLVRKKGEQLTASPTPTVGAAKPVQRRLKPEQADELVTAYRAGSSVADLARRFAVERETVYRHLHGQGVPLRPRGLPTEDVEEATKLYEQGLSLVTVGKRFGVGFTAVKTAFRKAGVPIRPRRGW